jgi:hypothetical protein
MPKSIVHMGDTEKKLYSANISFKTQAGRVPVAHACNPTDRRITVQSQPRQIVCKTFISKKPITKMSWWSGSRCRP